MEIKLRADERQAKKGIHISLHKFNESIFGECEECKLKEIRRKNQTMFPKKLVKPEDFIIHESKEDND